MNAKAYPVFLTRLIPLPELWNKVHIESEETPHDFDYSGELMQIQNDAFVDGHSVGDRAA
jgi:hypothetical protein